MSSVCLYFECFVKYISMSDRSILQLIIRLVSFFFLILSFVFFACLCLSYNFYVFGECCRYNLHLFFIFVPIFI